MRPIRDLPIQKKLTVIIMLTCGAALLLACAGFVAYDQVSLRHGMVRDLAILSDLYDDNVASGLAFDDPQSIQETLKSLNAHPRILVAAVYDKSGALAATYRRSDWTVPLVPPLPDRVGTEFRRNRLESVRRIVLAGEEIGTIFVASDLLALHARLRQYAVILGLTMAASAIAAFLLSRRLQRIISEPISHLLHVANLVASDNNYALRAVKQGNDELGRLVEGFNGMLVQIQDRDSALERAREDLEKRVEERTRALRASEERIRLIVETAFDAIITADADGTILEWNGQAERTFGWSRSEALGRDFLETVIPAQLRDAQRRSLEQCLAAKRGEGFDRRIETSALHKNGHNLPVELAISHVMIGSTSWFSAFVRDITERKKSEAELEAIHRQLVNASREAGMAEVATSVLHNVGNVLNSVNVSATLAIDTLRQFRVGGLGRVVETLRDHEHDLGEFVTNHTQGKQLLLYLSRLADHLQTDRETTLRELDALRQNIEHIKEIVAMQQNYAKVSGVTESIRARDLIEDALRFSAGALRRHEVEVALEIETDPKLVVDKHKVLQILVNLIRNAKYACDESGRADKRLTMRLSGGEGLVRIAVVDNGIGIHSDNLTRIFNHGFTTRKGGHGFGLHSGALAAKELGGDLLVHSDGPGKGAVFILELPCAEEITPA